MKRVPSAAVVVFFTIAVAGYRDRNVTGAAPAPPGTTPGAATAARPLRIAMIAKSASNPSFVAARTGAENRARELSASLGRPVQIEWLTPPQEDGAVGASHRPAVKEGMNAVLLSCSDARTATPAIDDAVAHGVPVMTFDSDAPDSRRFTYCGVDDVRTGEMMMEELARLVPRGAHVAVLAGNRAAPNLSRRVEGILREAARHPDIKVVGTFYTVETPEEASATVVQIDAAHPDIDGWAMVGGWALYTKTLLHDLQQDNRRRRKPVKIVSINALPPSSRTSKRAWRRCCSRSRRTCAARSASTRSWTRSRAENRCRRTSTPSWCRLLGQSARLGASAAGVGFRRRAGRTAPPRKIGGFGRESWPFGRAADTHFHDVHALVPSALVAGCSPPVAAAPGRRGSRTAAARSMRPSTWRSAAAVERERPAAAATGSNGGRRTTTGAEIGAACAAADDCRAALLRRHLLPIRLLGLCQSCAQPGSVGTCMNIPVGTDPRDECPDDGVAGCMRDGFCDGTGASRCTRAGNLPRADLPASTVTRAALCDSDGTYSATTNDSCGQCLCGSDGKLDPLCDRRRLRRGRGVCATEAAGRSRPARRARSAATARRRSRAKRLLQDRVRGNVQVVHDRGQRRWVHRRSERRRTAVAVRGRGRDGLRRRRTATARAPAGRTRADDLRRGTRAPDERRCPRAPATAPASA